MARQMRTTWGRLTCVLVSVTHTVCVCVCVYADGWDTVRVGPQGHRGQQAQGTEVQDAPQGVDMHTHTHTQHIQQTDV